MIRKIRHRGLKRLYEDDDGSRLNAEHVEKLREILSMLDQARSPSDMQLPGYRLHPLKGHRGVWSVRVSGNWRVTFKFDGQLRSCCTQSVIDQTP